MIARRTPLLLLTLLVPLGGAAVYARSGLARGFLARAVYAQDAAPETGPQPALPPPPPRRARPASAHGEGGALDTKIVWLDPAHGGSDRGGKLPGGLDEADLTFAFAARLRTVLTERGFTVIDTRRTAADTPSADARAEEAGRAHAGACVLLHGTEAGHGIHLFTSALAPPPAPAPPTPGSPELRPILAWDTAQAELLPASARLLGDLRDALETLRIPITAGHVSLPPLDSLHCPAVVVEIAPLVAKAASSGGAEGRTELADPGYEARVADALAAGLSAFRTRAEAQVAAEKAAATPPAESKPAPAMAPPAARPRP